MKCQKGWDKAATDALTQVTMRLDVETVKSILNGVTMGSTGRADAHDTVVAEAEEEIHKQVWEADILATATHMCVNLHVTYWVVAQWEDPVLKAVINWISNQKARIWSIFWEMTQTLGMSGHPLRVDKADTLPRSPLPSQYTGWWAGKSFAVCSPHSSSSACYGWMSQRSWTPGSAENSVPTTGLVLVAWHGHADAESN